MSHVDARVTIVWATLLESCGIKRQLEQALVVLVYIKLRVLDARSLWLRGRRGVVADGRAPSPSPRRIDPCAVLRAVLGKTMARRTRTPPGRRGASSRPSHARGVARSAARTPPSCTGSSGRWEMRRFLDDRACGALRAQRSRRQGFRW